jgi:hypothetical protein
MALDLERLARNHVLFREVNERVREVLDVWPERGEPGEFVCECSNEECAETILLTIEEYEAVRASGNFFVVACGHEIDAIERVLGETDTYKLVEKLEGARYAIETDPRSRPNG